MVSVLTERQIENEPITDRPDGRSVFFASTEFYSAIKDIFPLKYGQVAQEEHVQDGTKISHTVLFDMGDSSGSYMTWQHVIANRSDGGRTNETITVTSDGEVTGWRANYSAQGQVRSTQSLEVSECLSAWEDIFPIIYSDESVSYRNNLKDQREAAKESLAEFIITREAPYTILAEEATHPEKAIRTGEDEQGRKVLTFLSRLSDRLFNEELEKRNKRQSTAGVIPHRPSPRPKQSFVNQLRLL